MRRVQAPAGRPFRNMRPQETVCAHSRAGLDSQVRRALSHIQHGAIISVCAPDRDQGHSIEKLRICYLSISASVSQLFDNKTLNLFVIRVSFRSIVVPSTTLPALRHPRSRSVVKHFSSRAPHNITPPPHGLTISTSTTPIPLYQQDATKAKGTGR